MIYIPARCDRCAQVSLVAAQECAMGEAPCASCGAACSVMPGCAYSDSDVPLFEALKQQLEEIEPGRASSAQLSLLLDDFAVWREPKDAFALLFEHEPALSRLSPTLEAHPGRARQALSILSTLLNERASSRGSSIVARAESHRALAASS